MPGFCKSILAKINQYDTVHSFGHGWLLRVLLMTVDSWQLTVWQVIHKWHSASCLRPQKSIQVTCCPNLFVTFGPFLCEVILREISFIWHLSLSNYSILWHMRQSTRTHTSDGWPAKDHEAQPCRWWERGPWRGWWKLEEKRCLGQVFLSDIMVIGYDWVICELSHC